MATQTATGSGSTNNNGGTTINGGAIDTSGPVSNNLSVADLGTKDTGYGSKVVKIEADDSDDFADTYGVIEANDGSSGGFNQRQSNDNFIVRGAGTERAGKINGDASELLNTPAAEFAGVPRGKDNTVSGSTKLGNPQWLFPMLPGSGRNPGLIEGAGTGDSYDFTSTTDGGVAGNDKVVAATKAVPGELTFRTGAPVPTTENLKARDSAE